MDFSLVQATTIDGLRSLPKPKKGEKPKNGRKLSPELQVFRVRADLIEFKEEPDHDFHVVIAEPSSATRTLVAEIADTACRGACESLRRDEMETVREKFIRQCGEPTEKFKKLRTPLGVTVTGVGFFDKTSHGKGAAPNGIELHPVLDFDFEMGNGECAFRAARRR